MGGACCDGHEAELERRCEEAEASWDAPLASCCAKDLAEQREANRVLTILRAHDPSTRKQTERNAVVAKDPPPVRDVDEDGSAARVGSYEDDLALFRRMRLAQLREQARPRQPARAVRVVTAAELEDLVKRRHGGGRGGPAVVVHFAVERSAFSHELGAVVDSLAAEPREGCEFVRVGRAAGSVVDGSHGARAVREASLCCFQAGSVKAVLFCEEMGGPEECDELAVGRWVDEVAGARSAKRAGGSTSDSEDEGEEDKPCHICGRTYPHEHIKAVTALAESSDEESFEDDNEALWRE